jgi:hypothetical protein
MSSHTGDRPDAITRAEMPASARSNPAVPIILGIVMTFIVLFLFLLFMGMIPFEAIQGEGKETKQVDTAVSMEEKQAMSNLNKTGSLYPNNPPAKPDPILSKLDAPFQAEEMQEEEQIDQ